MHNGHQKEPFDQEGFQKLVNEMAAKGRALLNEGLANAKEILTEQTETLKKKAEEFGLEDTAADVRSYVQSHPLRSIGIALAVGVILGRLLAPSEKE